MVFSRLLNNKNNACEKDINKFIAFLSYYITITLIIIIDFMLLKIHDRLNVDFIQSTYFVDINNFVAEKSEFRAYVFSMISFPIIYCVLFFVLNKNKNMFIKYNICYINKLFKIVSAFLLFLLFITVSWINYENYFPIVHHFFICFILIFILMFMCLNNKKVKKISCFFTLFIYMIICFISFLHVNYNYAQNGYMLHHFDAYYYPILKIQSGLTPLVDFKSLYGNYSYFFAFILSFFNDNKIFVFSIICSILVFISYFSLSFFSSKVIKNRIVWFITMGIILFTSFVSSFYDMSSIYLQFIPHRIIFPSIILLYILFYIKRNGDKKFLKFLGYFICSLSLFWNLETGIVVTGTWTLFLLYELFYFNNFNKKTLLKCFNIFCCLFISVLFYLALIFGIVYTRTGKIFSLLDLLNGILIFSGDGCMMLRMRFLHPWVLLVLIYSFGLVLSFKNFRTGCFFKNAMYFVLSILGVGIFAYYQGRSDDGILYSVLYPGMILLGMFLDRLIEKNKYRFIVCFCSLFMSFYTVAMVDYLIDYRTKNFIKKRDLKYNFIEDKLSLYSSFVNEKFDFIVNYESMYYSYFNLKDVKKFSAWVDLFKYEDIKKIIEYMKVCSNNVVIQSDIYSIIKDKYYNDYKLLKERYNISKFDDGNYVFMLRGD